MLQDDPVRRWDIDEVLAWTEGRRLSPKQGRKENKAARPIEFNNNKYDRAINLAIDLRKDVSSGAAIILEGDLEQWIERSLDDKDLLDMLQKVAFIVKRGQRLTIL